MITVQYFVGDVGEGGEILRNTLEKVVKYFEVRQGGFREGLRLDGIESQRRRGRLLGVFPPDTNRRFFSPQVSWF